MKSKTKHNSIIQPSRNIRYGDPHISTLPINSLEWGSHILCEDIPVTVEDGWVTFEGEVPCCRKRSQYPWDNHKLR